MGEKEVMEEEGDGDREEKWRGQRIGELGRFIKRRMG